MNVTLWIIQLLLAFVFLMAGGMKLARPKEKLIKTLTTLENFSQIVIWTIGTVEVLGAIGVILPALTGILPWLTPLAAVGLALTMIGAAMAHLQHDETSRLVINVVIFLLALFIAYGRFSDVHLIANIGLKMN